MLTTHNQVIIKNISQDNKMLTIPSISPTCPMFKNRYSHKMLLNYEAMQSFSKYFLISPHPVVSKTLIYALDKS